MTEKKVYPERSWPEYLMPPGGTRVDPVVPGEFTPFLEPEWDVRHRRTEDVNP